MKRILLFGLIGLLALTVLFVGCFGIPLPYDVDMFSAKGYFQDHGPQKGTDRVGDYEIAWSATGNPKGPWVVFVHGSPGSWENFARFLDDEDLASRARLVAIDRPGYGGTTPSRPERSLEVQAAAVRPQLERAAAAGSRVILVGHSYGGPVAVRAAIDAPATIESLILVAPSIDPDLENLAWYQFVGDWPIVRWAVPKILDISNQEVLALRRELEGLEGLWSAVHARVTVIQGMADSLVDHRNADFAERVFTSSANLEVIRLADANHFIPWTDADVLREAIVREIERLERQDLDK